MPVSDIANIAPILREVALINPKGVIELGVGFGKYGVLCREILDATYGRCKPSSWEHIITGIEGFPEYVNPCWSAYNQVVVEDFKESYTKITGWPLVLMIDSLEHVEKVTAQIILHYLVENNERVIVSVPVGNCPQGAVFNNELEVHRSTWSGPSEFSQYIHRVLHEGICCVVSIKGRLIRKP